MGGDDYYEGIGIEHPDLLKGLNTVAVRKNEIEEYEIVFIERLQARPDGGFNDNLIAKWFEGLSDDPSDAFIVVYNKNPLIHIFLN
jgi:hypothetical protein